MTLTGIAAGLLYPLFGILLSPMIAGAAMSFSSVSVIAMLCVCGISVWNRIVTCEGMHLPYPYHANKT